MDRVRRIRLAGTPGEEQGPMTAAVDCDFVLAHLTLPHLLPPAFISVAAGAGYQGVSIRLIPANPLTERQLPMFGASSLLAETLAQMNATGIYVNDIEVLKVEPRVNMSELERVLETAARLRARNLVVVVADDVETRIAENLRSVADLTAAYGLRTCLECMVYMGVKTIEQGARIITQTDRTDIGLVIDALHLDRAGEHPADVARLAAGQIACVQLCDAGPRPDPTDLTAIMAEAREARLVPGRGLLPLTGLLRVIPAGVPVSLEVPVEGLIGEIPDVAIATLMRDSALEIMADC